MTARAMLAAALDLVRAGWARQALAEDWDGNRVRPWSARAQRWSATGALIAVWYRLPHRGDARPDLDRAYLALRATVGDVDAWNQAPGCSHAEVVAAFEKAIRVLDEQSDPSLAA